MNKGTDRDRVVLQANNENVGNDQGRSVDSDEINMYLNADIFLIMKHVGGCLNSRFIMENQLFKD